MTLVLRQEPCQSEIRNFGLKFFVQKDVAWLDISMNNCHVVMLVQVREPSCRAKYYVVPLFPAQTSSFITYVICNQNILTMFFKGLDLAIASIRSCPNNVVPYKNLSRLAFSMYS